MRVVQLRPSANIVLLAGDHEAGELQKRHVDHDDPFRWNFASISLMEGRNTRLIRMDEIGRLLR